MSEKDTDRCMQNLFMDVFHESYNTFTDNKLFRYKRGKGKETVLKPDGWYWLDQSTLLIIENKYSISDDDKAKEQVKLYASCAYHNSQELHYIICINGFGSDSSFAYKMYEFTRTEELHELSISTLEELNDIYTSKRNNNRDEKNKSINLQTFHDQIVSQTKIEDVANLSIITSFLILCSKFPDIKKIVDSTANTAKELLFEFLKSRFESFYGSFPIIQTQFYHPAFKTLNFIPLIRMVMDTHFVSLNDLYAQFCKYAQPNKNIVLTPPDIVELMKFCLSEYEYNTICDPFAGSSELLLYTSPTSHKIAIEITDYMHLMSKINFEINEIKNYELIKGDSSKINFSADVAFTNPPYTKNVSKRDAIEWIATLIGKVDVIIAIIPTTNLNNSACFNKWKKVLMDNGYFVRKIINCGKCFHKISVVASIVVMDNFEEKTPYKLFNCEMTKGVDVKQIPHVGRVLKPSGQAKIDAVKNDNGYELIENYDYNTAWAESPNMKKDVSEIKKINKIKKFKLDVDEQIKLYFIPGSNLDSQMFKPLFDALDLIKKNNSIYSCNDKVVKVKFSDLFEQIRCKTHTISNCSEVDKSIGYPLISASTKNNGIAAYIDKYDLDGQYLSITKGGDGGYALYQNGKFSITSSVVVFELKNELKTTTENNEKLYITLAKYITNQRDYDWALNKPSTDKILSTVIEIEENDPILQLIPEALIESPELIKFSIGDAFEIVKCKTRFVCHSNEVDKSAGYPIISASKVNNGINTYINEYDLDGRYLTVAVEGTRGYTTYQNGKFSITHHLKVIKLKDALLNTIDENYVDDFYKHISGVITENLMNKYDSFDKIITINKLLSEVLELNSSSKIFQFCPKLLKLNIGDK